MQYRIIKNTKTADTEEVIVDRITMKNYLQSSHGIIKKEGAESALYIMWAEKNYTLKPI